MLYALVLATFSTVAGAAAVPRSFLSTAFRAARIHQGDGPAPAPAPWDQKILPWAYPNGAPAVAPAPPAPPPPKPNPPKFPVIGQDECKLFQEAFLVSPGASCNHVIFAGNMDGCTCTTVLPASINPQPAAFYNPWLVEITPDPSIPLPEPMATVPPPSNPMMPFIAPAMPPVCPFLASCPDPNSFDCVGFNSWGFADAKIADYSPAAAALNSVSCTYMMKPYMKFKVPERVVSLWKLNAKLVKVMDSMQEPFTMVCDGEDSVKKPSLEEFCKDQLGRLGSSCTTDWAGAAKTRGRKCRSSPAPDGFEFDSTLAELCPMQCGWKKGVTRWPPFLTAAEQVAADKEADKKKE